MDHIGVFAVAIKALPDLHFAGAAALETAAEARVNTLRLSPFKVLASKVGELRLLSLVAEECDASLLHNLLVGGGSDLNHLLQAKVCSETARALEPAETNVDPFCQYSPTQETIPSHKPNGASAGGLPSAHNSKQAPTRPYLGQP